MELTQGRALSEAVMIALTQKGINRQEAHELLRKIAIKSLFEKKPFRESLLCNSLINKTLSVTEIDYALNPKNYLGNTLSQIDCVIQQTLEERKSRSY